jgi:hypothetical protein
MDGLGRLPESSRPNKSDLPMHQIKYLVGSPVLTPYPFVTPLNILDAAFSPGTVEATETGIEVKGDFGARVVFTGTFTVSGGEVTGGTMTGFEVYLGKTLMTEAKGYSTAGAALFDAIETYDSDSEPFYSLILGAPTRYVGSKFNEMITDGLAGDVELDDLLIGRNGSDILFGYLGDDTLRGGKGNDWLSDYAGTNKFFGGAGDDTFGFQFFTSGGATETDAVARIKDFVRGEDIINLTTDIVDLPFGELARKHFHKGTGPEDGNDYVIYDKATGRIFVDFDGSGTGGQIHFASVTAGIKLQAHDFIVGFGLV